MKLKIFMVIGMILILAGVVGIYLYQSHSTHSTHKVSSAEEKKTYFCPMHPNYTSDKPGDCPICGMKLVLMEKEESPAEEHAEHEEATEGAKVSGQATITLSPEREQLIGVKTEEVVYRELERVVNASARVAYDPDLYSAITEYQSALQGQERARESAYSQIEERSNSLVTAAILRLRQMGLSQSQIDAIHAEDPSPTDLILTEKGDAVWLYIQVYEYESGLIQAGQSVEATSSAFKGRKFLGTVRAVDPILSAESRSLKVRARVENPEGLLKPQMYLDAKIRINLGRKLVIPEEAVLNTGERQLAFVLKGKGRYEPRELTLGEEGAGYVEVIKGVSVGERVVSSANFLIDSESKLKSALASPEHRH